MERAWESVAHVDGVRGGPSMHGPSCAQLRLIIPMHEGAINRSARGCWNNSKNEYHFNIFSKVLENSEQFFLDFSSSVSWPFLPFFKRTRW